MRSKDFLPMLSARLEASQGVDVVINNAAEQGPVGKSWDIPHDLWAQTVEVDLLMPVAICQMAVPFMIKRASGKIINISGGGAATSRPGYSAYAVAKTGLVRFTECLADEVRDCGIDVNAIAPGKMPTRLCQDTPEAKGDPFAEPVALCLYLASAISNGISGKLISAVWDDWRHLHENKALLQPGELYTLRRVAKDTV
jgi:3-oxoacyl-[acyl-carrier protein] reductase